MEIINLYENRLKKFGKSVKTMGWRDRNQQYLRFDILYGIGDLNNRSILDVGCGFGDFYDYLNQKGIRIDYTGYDLSPKIIEVAKKNYPNLKFEVKDILKDPINEKFNYVVESGILNRKILDNIEYAKAIIKKMFELCKIGIAANMMTNYVDYKEDYLFYYSSEEIFRFCKSLSRWVVLRHDYPLYEFTIYIYKNLTRL